MKTFYQLTEALEADIMGLMKTFGAGDVEVTSQYVSAMLRKKQQILDIVDIMPPNMDFEVFVYEVSNVSGDKKVRVDMKPDSIDDIDFDGLSDDTHEYQLIIYLYNTSVYTEHNDIFDTDLALSEAKRVTKVDARGQRTIKLKCKKGFKFAGGKCVQVTGSELVTKKLAIRKAVKTKKSKGAGFTNRVQRLRKRALRKRKGMGIKNAQGH